MHHFKRKLFLKNSPTAFVVFTHSTLLVVIDEDDLLLRLFWP